MTPAAAPHGTDCGRTHADPTPVAELPAGADVRLVVADMDGTLLTPEGEVADATWAVLTELRRRGIVFAPASGRQYATLLRTFADVADGMVFVAENGANVVRDGVEIDSTPLEPDIAVEVVRRVRGLAGPEDAVDVGVVVCGTGTAYVERSDEAFLAEARRYYAALEVVDDLAAVAADGAAGIVKVAVYDFGEVETRVAPELVALRDRARVMVSGHHWVDVMSGDADKGVALRRLQQELGVTAAQTVVFGDYLNDLGMYSAAELTFAMANAHPEVLAAARYVAPSNAEDGVATTLRALLDR